MSQLKKKHLSFPYSEVCSLHDSLVKQELGSYFSLRLGVYLQLGSSWDKEVPHPGGWMGVSGAVISVSCLGFYYGLQPKAEHGTPWSFRPECVKQILNRSRSLLLLPVGEVLTNSSPSPSQRAHRFHTPSQ